MGRGKGHKTFGAFSGPRFLQSLQLQVENSAKAVPENSTGLVGTGLSESKLRLISSILCTKNSLNLSGRDSRKIFEGSIVSQNVPII